MDIRSPAAQAENDEHSAPHVEPASHTTQISEDFSTQQCPTDLDEHMGNSASALVALNSTPGNAQTISTVAALAPNLAVSETSPPG